MSTPRYVAKGTRLAVAGLLIWSLAGCNMLHRLAAVGEEPELTGIEQIASIAPKQPVEMPMPKPIAIERQPNSLWRPGSRAFFKDQRASQVGDILTLVIDIDDGAQLNNSTNRVRAAEEAANLPAFLGFETQLAEFLPDAVNPDDLIDFDSDSLSDGTGAINRDESINLRVAGTVTQVLPNGNLVVAGRQEVRVNYEMRELQVAGIIRPEDITSTNTINFDQIAEARIAYGGRGILSDVQQPRYGQQIFDILWPW